MRLKRVSPVTSEFDRELIEHLRQRITRLEDYVNHLKDNDFLPDECEVCFAISTRPAPATVIQ